MSAKFDPYYTWLGIPPEEQPPHHYRLLSVQPLEENLDAIENAADRQMKHLRDFQTGKHAEHSQKLLNEIAAARLVLLDPAKKKAYDVELRTKLNATKQAELKRAREERPLATAHPLPTATPLDAKPVVPAPAKSAAPQFSAATLAQPRGSNTVVLLIVAGVGALVLLASGGIATMIFLAGHESVAAVTPATNITPGEVPDTTDNVTLVVPPVIPWREDNDEPTVETSAVVDENVSPKNPKVEPPPNDDPLESIDDNAVEQGAGEELIAVEDVPPAKLPVPDKAEREAKRKQILQVFAVADARTFEQKGELAAQLIRTAGETTDDPAAQFALLNLAREQAAEAGQIKLAFEATDLLAATFEFDGEAVRLASLQQASRATLPPAAKAEIVAAGMEMIDELSAADKFEEAGALSDRLLAIARPLRDAELIKRLVDQRKAFTELAASYKNAQTAFEILKTAPDDPEANLTAGLYLAFVKQDWQAGPAHIAKGSDALLAAAAKAELALPQATADIEKLADAWWAAAEAQKKATTKNLCRANAGYWYRKIVDDLSGLSKVRVEKRIEQAGTLPRSSNNSKPNLALSRDATEDLKKGLVAHWTFDEGTGTIAGDAVGKCNGTIQGATWVEGVLGKALSFDGKDDAVLLGNPEVLNFDGAISLAAWVRLKRDSAPQGPADVRFFIGHEGGGKEVYLRRSFRGYVCGTGIGQKQHFVASPIPGDDIGVWVHMAATNDGETWRLYRNGVLLGENEVGIGAVRCDGDWGIGGHASGRHYCGELDDVRMYRRVLSPEEVVALAAKSEVLIPETASEAPSEPQLEILHASLGENQGQADVTDVIRQLVTDESKVITVSTAGLGLKNPSGKFRRFLIIQYKLNGIEHTRRFENGEQINIRKELVAPPQR